ncbi:hypothetical protein CKF54_07305 [Psittacicella hinzii]|uniref:ATP-binding cassette transporter n=1 Tax=Psittacicella hinzii TaxID=2028575 RepID=A0A3A1Y1K8_9GAMM|nr:ABC transporter ATP-binding protein/permease [Psittacicella hinzii]RIY31179.1 hypothetical protein CKF54_07305 [Psittacicella hinzii]
MQTLTYFGQLARSFWWQKSAWRPWLLFLSTLATSIIIVQTSVYIALWNKEFYDALAALEKDVIWQLVGQYFIYIGIIVACVVIGSYLRKRLMFYWREALTKQLQEQWLAHHNHYRLQQEASYIDNPDQRIAEDVMLLCNYTIDLLRGLFMNIFRLVSFVAILWSMSNIFTLYWKIGNFSFNLQVHGYLVWVALFYSLLCSVIMHMVGYKLQALNVEQQHREANYRAQLIRLQEASEAIALYRGEAREKQTLNNNFAQIKTNWLALIYREVKVETFSATTLRITLFIPLLATLPMYLAGLITFGGMMQARSAFTNVQDGFNWFVDSYKTIIKWAAVVQRLGTFQAKLQELEAQAEQFNYHPQEQAQVVVRNLELCNNKQRPLLRGVNFNLKGKGWYQLQGASGIGKTSLLRTLAGLNPHYQGQVEIAGQSYLFLPQKPYVFKDSLRNLLSYPSEELDHQQALNLLKLVGLSHLQAELEEVKNWQQILSGGEQQRLSLARALVKQPQVIFLDEATNQLDSQSARQLYLMLKEQLPQSLVIGVCHQSELAELFEQQIDLEQFRA